MVLARSVAQSSPSKTLAQQVAATLREEIIAGELAPGVLIAEVPTADRLGVSRLPVREATLMLEREGLLVLEGRGRRRVRSLDPQDLEEILDLRQLLEPELTALAAERHTAGDLEALEANLARLAAAKRFSRVSLFDIEFHDRLTAAARHSRLGHVWRMSRGHIQLFTAALQRGRHQDARAVRDSTVIAHREILDHVRARNAPAARLSVQRHLQIWKPYIEALREGRAS